MKSASLALYALVFSGLDAACANHLLMRLSARIRSTSPLATASTAGFPPRRSKSDFSDFAACGKDTPVNRTATTTAETIHFCMVLLFEGLLFVIKQPNIDEGAVSENAKVL